MNYIRTITYTAIILLLCTYVLLTASSVKAEVNDYEKDYFKAFLDIKTFDKDDIVVYFTGDGAEKIGLDAGKLTDYLRLRVKNNFSDIGFDNYELDLNEVGFIRVRVWVVGKSYPIAFFTDAEFISYDIINGITELKKIARTEQLGYGSKDNVPDKIKNLIGDMVEELAILFYEVRGEL